MEASDDRELDFCVHPLRLDAAGKADAFDLAAVDGKLF